MDKVIFIGISDPMTETIVEHAIIDRGNGEFTSMLKSDYDEMKANEPTLEIK